MRTIVVQASFCSIKLLHSHFVPKHHSIPERVVTVPFVGGEILEWLWNSFDCSVETCDISVCYYHCAAINGMEACAVHYHAPAFGVLQPSPFPNPLLPIPPRSKID